jgi:hypothetical protein
VREAEPQKPGIGGLDLPDQERRAVGQGGMQVFEVHGTSLKAGIPLPEAM